MIKLRIKIIFSFLFFLFMGSKIVHAQVEDPNNFSVISDPLSTLNTAQGWSLQDNGKWAYEINIIPNSNSRTVRNPSPKERLGIDNFIRLELKKVLIEDKQYNVLIKIYRDGEYEFPMLEDGWVNYNSAKFWVFPAENLINVFPEEVEFDNAYAVNLDVYCFGEIDDYNPYTLGDKIVNKINRTIDATNVNAANLVIAVWPLRDNDTEVIRFKIIETYNKRTLTGYYLEPSNIKKIFANSYYQTYYYEFKNFIKDAVIYNIPVESVSNEYMSFYRWGVLKYQAGNYDGAVQDFDKALELNPESKDFMLFSYRGNAKTKLRDFNGAIEDFDRALDIEPTEVADYSNWVRNYYNRGVAKFYINDMNGACRDWHDAYELGFGVALEYLNKYCQ